MLSNLTQNGGKMSWCGQDSESSGAAFSARYINPAGDRYISIDQVPALGSVRVVTDLFFNDEHRTEQLEVGLSGAWYVLGFIFNGETIEFTKDYDTFRAVDSNSLVGGFTRNEEFHLEFQYWRPADAAWGQLWDDEIANGDAKHIIGWVNSFDEDGNVLYTIEDTTAWTVTDGDSNIGSRSVNRAANVVTESSYAYFYVRENEDVIEQ